MQGGHPDAAIEAATQHPAVAAASAAQHPRLHSIQALQTTAPSSTGTGLQAYSRNPGESNIYREKSTYRQPHRERE